MTSRPSGRFALAGDPQWYKDAIIYELHVRAFHDSDGDGIGDFLGLTQKLDYLQDLGVTAIWLLPFYPSPLRDDGYDIADYRSINPAYGTMQDFRNFLQAAHQRGIRVITELVLNHTSDQHAWFQRARRSRPGTRVHDYYVWSDDPTKYSEARIIFKDFEGSNWTLDPIARSHFWHRFYHHQPDLNFENPAVRRELLRVVDFWLGMGVDGLRLDAVPYLFERDGTNCENLPETHEFLKELRAHVDTHFPNRMLLAEANQWPEDAVAYLGDGDECHMAFHFPVMPRLFMAIQMEDRFPIIDILRQTPPIHENAQWALFLRNHDELTLEMVTDEERDYMYRVYASDPQARINLGIRRRLAPLLGNNIRQMELMNGLLFSLPGTPIIYYGDEIGMGDNVYLGDRNGVRTPMQWSADRNAGFSRANPQRLYSPVVIDPGYHYEAVNVESQQSNPNLFLWWMKRLISVRKQMQVFGRGTLEFLYPDNPKVLAYLRCHEDQTVLVVANLSRYAQGVNLDLSRFSGSVPLELFGHTEFPPIGDSPYTVTLAPHSFYWFSLEPQRAAATPPHATRETFPTLQSRGSWQSVFARPQWPALAKTLVEYAQGRRWFGGKARRIQSSEVLDAVPVGPDENPVYLCLFRVSYGDGEPETYALFLGHASGDEAARMEQDSPQTVVARVSSPVRSANGNGLLFDALTDTGFSASLLSYIAKPRRFRSGASELFTTRTRAYQRLRGPASEPLTPALVRAEQSNTSVVYGNRFILKMFRRPGAGLNPDLEIGRFLTEKARFPHTAPVAGAIEYQARRSSEPMTIAILQGYAENEGDAWRFTLHQLGQFFDRVLARSSGEIPAMPKEHILDMDPGDMPEAVEEAIGQYVVSAALLGARTAQMHLALASAGPQDKVFAPEPFSAMYQRSVYAALRGQFGQVFQHLGRRMRYLPGPTQELARQVHEVEPAALRRLDALRARRLDGMRIRVHGDYHLGQVLYTGRDFVIIDFEGEPARPVTERRLKRSPMKDVAGMLRSFDYAANAALLGQAPSGLRPEDVPALEPWVRIWIKWVSAAYLHAYLDEVGDAGLLPSAAEDVRALLDAYLLEKVTYEISYEMNNRPEWVQVPLRGLLDLIED